MSKRRAYITNNRIIFISIGIVALIFTSFVDSVYRHWIYSNHYFDFGLANYFPSITGTITAIFILCGLSKNFPKDTIKSSTGVIIGCAIYEFIQPIIGTGIFDWQDLVAIILTGAVCHLLLIKLLKPSNKYANN